MTKNNDRKNSAWRTEWLPRHMVFLCYMKCVMPRAPQDATLHDTTSHDVTPPSRSKGVAGGGLQDRTPTGYDRLLSNKPIYVHGCIYREPQQVIHMTPKSNTQTVRGGQTTGTHLGRDGQEVRPVRRRSSEILGGLHGGDVGVDEYHFDALLLQRLDGLLTIMINRSCVEKDVNCTTRTETYIQ